MIICGVAEKFNKNTTYLSTGYVDTCSGSAPHRATAPKVPRIPVTKDSMPRVWRMYFEELDRFLKEHVSDYQMHKRT
jgi:hypothetical protein